MKEFLFRLLAPLHDLEFITGSKVANKEGNFTILNRDNTITS